MLRADLGPVTEEHETTKGLVRHSLREQRKVSGSLMEGRVPLTKKELIAIFLKRTMRALTKNIRSARF